METKDGCHFSKSIDFWIVVQGELLKDWQTEGQQHESIQCEAQSLALTQPPDLLEN